MKCAGGARGRRALGERAHRRAWFRPRADAGAVGRLDLEGVPASLLEVFEQVEWLRPCAEDLGKGKGVCVSLWDLVGRGGAVVVVTGRGHLGISGEKTVMENVFGGCYRGVVALTYIGSVIDHSCWKVDLWVDFDFKGNTRGRKRQRGRRGRGRAYDSGSRFASIFRSVQWTC